MLGESEKSLVRRWRCRMPINWTCQCLLFDWLISLENQQKISKSWVCNCWRLDWQRSLESRLNVKVVKI